LIPTLLVGEPFPFKIVFGIEDALRPAACEGATRTADEKRAIVVRMAKRWRFTGDLQVVGV
jgi:hypothetical protein